MEIQKEIKNHLEEDQHNIWVQDQEYTILNLIYQKKKLVDSYKFGFCQDKLIRKFNTKVIEVKMVKLIINGFI